VPAIGTSARPRSGGVIGRAAPQRAGRADPGATDSGSGDGTLADRTTRIAHDLHTPVAIILGLCSRIEAGNLDAQQTSDLERIRAQAGAISAAAATLLIPSEDSSPPPLLLDAVHVAREVASDVAVLARERGARVIVDAGHAAYVRDDHGQLRSAITNLVTNALRQVDEGGCVRCSVRCRASAVTIEVADSGRGVPVDERAAVLRPFTQGSGVSGRAGLGLSIVSDSAGRLGGTIRISDAHEGGAAFTLTVPQAHHPGPHQRRRRSGQRV